jgi:SAM-dependent methyltransferase
VRMKPSHGGEAAPVMGDPITASRPTAAVPALRGRDRSSARSIEAHFFPEIGVAGFSHLDQEVAFYSQVAALLRPEHRLLDFGAGNGRWLYREPCQYKRRLQDFRGRCARVDGCDPDPRVLSNDSVDFARRIELGEPLPYPDESFDLVVSRYVFEHLADPARVAHELLRVTRRGGWICAMTPNRWSYVALANALLPQSLRRRLLRAAQPDRTEDSIFPAFYRLNTPRAACRHFAADADIFHYCASSTPAYHFGAPVVFRVQMLVDRLLPSPVASTLQLFIRRRRSGR